MSRGFSITGQPGFPFIALLCFAVLYLPVATLVLYAFNAGDSVAVWSGFSLRWFHSAWQNTQVQEATMRSALIAVVAEWRLLVLGALTIAVTLRVWRTRHGGEWNALTIHTVLP